MPGKQIIDAYICGIGWEEALCNELKPAGSAEAFSSPAPGLVVGTRHPSHLKNEPVFARNWLPDCCEIRGESIADLVQALGRVVDAFLDQSQLPWTFVAFSPDLFTEESTKYEFIAGRPALLQEKFFERMAKYRRRAFERFVDWLNIDDRRPCLIVQVVMTGNDRAWVSVCERFRAGKGRYLPVIWRNSPGLVEHDHLAPCRSYYKLEEAWNQTGIFPRKNDVCVDLGAAPGGWTWAALKRGARVTAVDFADLKPHVEKHPRCEHSIDNGYAYMPQKTVDWMFCDMIVKPMSTLGLLDRWLEAKACRRFVVNVKFRGKQPETILLAIDELAKKHGLSKLVIRHLYYDRNEITLIGQA